MKVVSVAEMQALDYAAINELGIPEEVLMENAGIAVARLLLAIKPDLRTSQTLVVCSTGNNGGDGLVIARQLHSLGVKVRVLIVGNPAKCTGAAKTNLRALSNIVAIPLLHALSSADIQESLKDVDIVVDALLGTGIDRPVEGIFAAIIRAINDAKTPPPKTYKKNLVVSVDIPSGINGNTGAIMGEAIRADVTVTLGLPKLGLLLSPGFEHCGKIYLSRISFPLSYQNPQALKISINEYLPLPPRLPQAHKKSVGTALIVAGSNNYRGAAYLAGAAFLRSGGGYATLASVPDVISLVAFRCPEIVVFPCKGQDGALSLTELPTILALAERAGMVILGPGLSLAPQAQALAQALIAKIKCPLVIDGDAISALANAPTLKRTLPTIITPHAGEIARLARITVAEVEANRVAVVGRLSRELGAHIVLKGPHSLISSPDGRIFINLTGNAGMATAGTGDVLTGIIAGMYGAGLSLEEALRKAVYIHGLAGDLASKSKGESGMIASDLLDSIPLALQHDQKTQANIPSITII
ncbi:MAG: NAD(P)H-hydrate dehydratase [Deltaproteobacteria bacterium]|nr:NAD(P)H-hydrate dehydratase [Deltaproteobacteria bacterium]